MTAPAPHTTDFHPQVESLKRRLMEQGWKTVYLHCVRIEMLALDLGLNWGLEVEPILLAVWGHDQFRLTKQDELLALARGWGLAITAEECQSGKRHPIDLARVPSWVSLQPSAHDGFSCGATCSNRILRKARACV